MKPFRFFILLFLSATIFNHTAYCQGRNTSKPKTKTNVSKFTGKWKGEEKCSDVSAPVALLFVSCNEQEIILSGLYSIQGEVKAAIKGDTITIARQEVKDPNFMNMQIEGKLAFGTNPFNLSGNIIVINNQKKDECVVRYYK